MVTSKQLVEKMRDYRRSLIHSWNLFRESRLGLIGMAIMLAFTIMAVAAPFMGLKHPVEWTAPSIDLLRADPYFYNPPNVTGLVNQSIGIRTVSRTTGETNSAEQNVDRIYVASGDRLYAYSFNGYPRWSQGTDVGMELPSEITTGVNSVNIGTTINEHNMVFVGCKDGTVWGAIDDIYEKDPAASKNERPQTDEIFQTKLPSAVTSDIAVYNTVHKNPDNTYDLISYDRLLVGTANGTVYCLNVNMGQIWATSVSNKTVKTVAIAEKKGIVVAGTEDGMVYAMRLSDGRLVWSQPYEVGADMSQIAIKNDGTWVILGSSDGRLHIIDTLFGTAVAGWEGGFPVNKTAGLLDEGVLQKPTMNNDASSIYVSSSTGFLYAVRTTSETPSVQWAYDAGHGISNYATFKAPAVYDPFTLSVYSAAQYYNGTPETGTNSYSVVFRISQDGVVNLNMTFDGVATLQPITCYVRTHGFVRGIVFAMQHPASGKTTLYSYSAAGEYLAPLKPTWLLKSEDKPKSGNTYWLGTDAQGRDILSQVIWGSRIALLVGFAAAAFSIGIGVVVGLVAGYYGGWVDIVLMRFTDVILVLPSLPLLIILAALLQPSIWNIVFIIGITGWGGPARVIRSAVLSLKERPFIDSARVTGASKMRIMFKHIAPNVLPLGLLYMTFYVGGAILSEASLAFIGLGDPRTMSWGMMLNFVQHSNALSNWWWLVPPGLCITLVCMAFFLVGRAFDEIVNPRLRKR